MPRYVILRHQPAGNSPRPLHWDLMFESREALRTFACFTEPIAGQVLDIEPLDDHRLAYLDYEGPVSGERGTVTQWDRGEFEVLKETDRQWVLDVQGRRWRGRVHFQAGAGHRWRIEFAEPVPAPD